MLLGGVRGEAGSRDATGDARAVLVSAPRGGVRSRVRRQVRYRWHRSRGLVGITARSKIAETDARYVRTTGIHTYTKFEATQYY